MEYARDLGQVELWEESLRRSLERRGMARRSSVELHRLRPARDLTLADVVERSASYSQLRRRAAERPGLPRPSAALTGVSAMALLAAATVPKIVGGGGAVHKPTAVLKEAAAPTPVSSHAQLKAGASIPRPATHPPRLIKPAASYHETARSATVRHSAPVPAPRAATPTPHATIASVSRPSGGAGLTAAPKHTVTKPRTSAAHPSPSAAARHATATSHASGGAVVKPKAKVTPTTPVRSSTPTAPPVSSGRYVNPLARASVTPERIDQGVDYSGSGTLTALGAGRVTYVGTSGTGWPGAFIEYRLTTGADAGRYVYYAETVSPLVRVGQTLRPGQSVAAIGGGIEIGWGSGVGTQPLAQAEGQWSHGSDAGNYASPAGRSFSALVASLGGPPGKLEG